MSLPNHTITSADSSRRDSNVPSGFSQAKPSKRDNPVMIADTAALQSLISARPMDIPLPPGFQVTVYNGGISQHYTLPSETVQITRGSIKYVDHHARYGPQTRFRFQLCHNYLQRKCTKLSECSYIHATVLPKPSEVHLNPFAPRRLAADRHGRSNDVIPSHFDDPSIADGYPTLPAGFVITVHPPQGNQTSNELTSVPSDMIIKTVGGDQIFAAYKDNGGEEPSNLTPDQLPRHCTKFQYRRVCTSGTECPFIHSKVPFPGTWIGIATTVPATTTAPIPPPSAPMQPPTTSVAPGLLPPGAVFAPAPHPPTFVSAPPNLGYAPQQMFYMPTVPLDQTMGVPGPQTWPQPAPFVQPAPAAMVMAPPPPQHPYMFSQPPAGVQYFVMMPPQ